MNVNSTNDEHLIPNPNNIEFTGTAQANLNQLNAAPVDLTMAADTKKSSKMRPGTSNTARYESDS